jgi:sugar lactone lactonase YvrE
MLRTTDLWPKDGAKVELAYETARHDAGGVALRHSCYCGVRHTMSTPFDSSRLSAMVLAAICVGQTLSKSGASEVLVVDRLSNTVDRYSSTGQFLGTLISNDPNLNQPDGIVVSPDHTRLFVASSQNNEVVEYDYNYAAGTATDPTVFATAAEGLSFPNSMVFSPDGSKLYVANLGGDGVTQLNLNGTSAGPNITGGSSADFSGMAFASGGQLLAAGFDGGTVARSNASVSSFSDLVSPNSSLQGAAGLLVSGNDLYVTGLFSGTLEKFNATTGQIDPTFTPATGLGFPQGVILAPGGNNLLVGILGFSDGGGNISEYSFNGTFLGTFASPVSNPSQGFVEATAMIAVSAPLPGDVNFDGIVNAQDIGVIASHWLQTGTGASDPLGDANLDGIVNAQDLALVASHWLQTSGASGTAVPEPGTILLFSIGFAGLIGVQWRRQRSARAA